MKKILIISLIISLSSAISLDLVILNLMKSFVEVENIKSENIKYELVPSIPPADFVITNGQYVIEYIN